MSMFEEKNVNTAEHFLFRTPLPGEEQRIAQIEISCFPPHEACRPEIMYRRLALFPENFIVAQHRETGELAGFIDGMASEEEHLWDRFYTAPELHEPKGRNILILGVNLLPQWRHQGLFRGMMDAFVSHEKNLGRQRAILTCLEQRIGMYEHYGFTCRGICDSAWGGEQWNEMILDLRERIRPE